MQIQYKPNIIGYSIVGKPGYSQIFLHATEIFPFIFIKAMQYYMP